VVATRPVLSSIIQELLKDDDVAVTTPKEDKLKRAKHMWTENHTHSGQCQLMSGYTNFAIAGAGNIGSYIVQKLLKDNADGIVKEVVVLSRQVKYLSNDLDYTSYAEYSFGYGHLGLQEHHSR
jgi:hypothetical protein